MTTLRAPALRPGDRVAVTAPSGPVLRPDRLEAGVAVLAGWGLEPVLAPHVRAVRGHLAGRDADRAADLDAAFADPAVRGIFAVRGGYGLTRLLDRLDWAALARDPKLLVGFSDVTALLLAAWSRLRLVTVHGPFAGRLHTLQRDAADHLHRLMFDGWAGEVPGASATVTVTGGRAEGRLVGGNLTLLTSLLATPDQPDLDGSILFLEDVHEAPYRLDRMLVQLRRAGLLERVAGIVVGELVGCEPPPGRPSATAEDVVQAELAGLGVPVVRGFPVGHVDHQLALPVGGRALLDAHARTLTLLEPAVSRTLRA